MNERIKKFAEQARLLTGWPVGEYSELKVVEIPDDVKWQLEEYDGLEWVAEKHRTWS